MIGSQMNGEPTSLGFRILRRDGSCCIYCGRTPQNDGVQLHVEDVNPRVADGSNEETNLITACMDCNLGKGKSAIRTI